MVLQTSEKAKIVTEFGKNAQDTGSTEVQIAILTKDIIKLTEHCQINPKDFSTKRGLLKKVCQRRSLLHYLERVNAGLYRQLIAKLGLRK